jgi:hypothetical protein
MGGRERTKVFRQEHDRDDVESQSEDLTQDHERMPSLHLDGDHDELVEDEGGEGDGDDVDELAFEEDEGGDHNRTTCRTRQCVFLGD